MSEQTIIADPLDDVLRGRSRDYVQSILTPDNPLDKNALSEDQRQERAEILAELYGKGYSLSKVSDITGLSKARINKILESYGYERRPVPGSKAWRDQKAKQQEAPSTDAE